MMRTDTPQTIYLKDYTPPEHKPIHIDLSFDIQNGKNHCDLGGAICKHQRQ